MPTSLAWIAKEAAAPKAAIQRTLPVRSQRTRQSMERAKKKVSVESRKASRPRDTA